MRDYFDDKSLDMGLAVAFKKEEILDAMKSIVAYNKDKLYGFTIDNVCVTCNTGWMSTLESNIKNFFTDASNRLVDSIADLELTTERRLVIAHWLLLKLLCMIHKIRLPVKIPNSTYSNLKKGIIEDGFIFEIFKHNAYGFKFCLNKGIIDQRRVEVANFDIAIARKLSRDLVCMTLHIGMFFFRVSFFNEETGLIRKTCIRKAEVIYPIDKKLIHHTIRNEDDFWVKTVEEDKVMMFNAGIFLTDKK
jgi:hypothetical protein